MWIVILKGLDSFKKGWIHPTPLSGHVDFRGCGFLFQQAPWCFGGSGKLPYLNGSKSCEGFINMWLHVSRRKYDLILNPQQVFSAEEQGRKETCLLKFLLSLCVFRSLSCLILPRTGAGIFLDEWRNSWGWDRLSKLFIIIQPVGLTPKPKLFPFQGLAILETCQPTSHRIFSCNGHDILVITSHDTVLVYSEL